MDGGLVAQVRADKVQQEREEVYAALQMQPAFTVWWRNGKIVKSLSPCQKRSGPWWTGKKRKKASNGMVCGSKQVIGV